MLDKEKDTRGIQENLYRDKKCPMCSTSHKNIPK
nr:MAG TPA_asm: tax1-binding protein [Caudoviricetes sp.]